MATENDLCAAYREHPHHCAGNEEVWMARYFFHVSDSDTFKDVVGRRFSDPEDAKAHAAVVAKELAQDNINWRGYSVVVTDEHGTEIARVPIKD
jgi:hypothetical protein